MGRDFVRGLRFPSFYVEDYDTAVGFYTQVLGAPDSDAPEIKGWKLGETWLTLFPSSAGAHPGSNPRGCEFAIEVGSREDVDRFYEELIAAGAKAGWAPKDTEMYDKMRFCFVEDPVGIRIDIYCLLPQ